MPKLLKMTYTSTVNTFIDNLPPASLPVDKVHSPVRSSPGSATGVHTGNTIFWCLLPWKYVYTICSNGSLPSLITVNVSAEAI